jgi:hypothetical protein
MTTPGLCQRCNDRPEVRGAVPAVLLPMVMLMSGSSGNYWRHRDVLRHLCRECAGEINGLGYIAAFVVGVLLLIVSILFFG